MSNKTQIKCVVWDLDNTLWEGILLEDGNVILKNEVVTIIKELDSRGILQSIASKNNYDTALDKIEEFQLEQYFLYPQINWNSKSSSIKEIVQLLNIGIDSIAFIDDQSFERDEVHSEYPEVLCLDVLDLNKILNMEEFIPNFITEDTTQRRVMYQNEIRRKEIEEKFIGPKAEFLKSLNLKLGISVATEQDLRRVEELTVRTHQMNTTGYIYSYDELLNIINDKRYLVLIAGLEDCYGSYGKIGLSVVEIDDDKWIIKLFLISCRVMSKGVGISFLHYIMNLAYDQNKRILAEFVETSKNRIMYMTYKFNGFYEISHKGTDILFEHKIKEKKKFPYYLTIY